MHIRRGQCQRWAHVDSVGLSFKNAGLNRQCSARVWFGPTKVGKASCTLIFQPLIITSFDYASTRLVIVHRNPSRKR